MNKAITVKSEFLWFLFKEFEFLIVMCSELQCHKGILSLAFYCFEEKKDLGTGNIILILNIAYIFSRLSFVVVEVLDKAGSKFRVMIILLWTCKDCRSGCLMKLCGTSDVSIGNFSVSGASSSGLFWAFSRE